MSEFEDNLVQSETLTQLLLHATVLISINTTWSASPEEGVRFLGELTILKIKPCQRQFTLSGGHFADTHTHAPCA